MDSRRAGHHLLAEPLMRRTGSTPWRSLRDPIGTSFSGERIHRATGSGSASAAGRYRAALAPCPPQIDASADPTIPVTPPSPLLLRRRRAPTLSLSLVAGETPPHPTNREAYVFFASPLPTMPLLGASSPSPPLRSWAHLRPGTTASRVSLYVSEGFVCHTSSSS
jgi:hypothetical protein